MKKERKKHSKKFKIITTSIVLSCIAVITTCLGFWFGFTDPGLSKEMNYDEFYSSWMKSIKDEVKITDVVMPGAHDAGTNGMMPQAMCQGHDIIDQLKGGVRYFDVRVTDKGEDLVIFHGPIKGQKFDKVANDFATFINANPSEFIIMDFQHLGDKVHQDTINMIKDILPMDKMLTSNTYPNINEVSMKTLRDNKLNFMVVWKDTKEAKENNFYTRDTSLRSEYDGDIHKESDEALIKQFETYYKNHEENKLFVLQAQRTAKTLLGKPSMYEKNFKPKVNEFINSLNGNAELLNKTNIIMRDFVISDKNNINGILNLNLAKSIVKKESVNTFISFVKSSN